MVPTVLAALTVALAVTGSSGEEYGGGAMPQYGSVDYERPEYHARSPDAAPHLDYKFEEDQHVNNHGEGDKVLKHVSELDHWRQPTRRQRKAALDEPKNESELEENNGSGRRQRRRWRNRQQQTPRRRSVLYDTHPTERFPFDDPTTEEYGSENIEDNIDYPEKKSKYLVDEERDRMTVGEALPSRARRKPRERIYVPPPPPRFSTGRTTDFMQGEDESGLVRRRTKENGSDKDDPEYWSDEERVLAGGRRRRPMLPPDESSALPPAIDQESERRRPMLESRKPKVGLSYPDYDNYLANYDAKKLNVIKNQVPNMVQRTSMSVQMPRMRFQPPEGVPRPRPWPSRRAGEPPEDLPALSPASPPAQLVTVPPSTSATTPQSAATYAPVSFVPGANESEPSLAERSRLSILKKAQLKESLGKVTNKKPPVLLQVTSRMPTVVMVLTATGDPWHRAREISGDSPETIEKVKRLMRQKLVASAKSIRDLTDNWDDTVCDYIDVGMLDAMPVDSAKSASPASFWLFFACSFVYDLPCM